MKAAIDTVDVGNLLLLKTGSRLGLCMDGNMLSSRPGAAPMRSAGEIMLRVRDIMTRELITVSPDTEVVYATKLLLENHINGVPVTDKTGKLVGILCQSDLIAQQKKLPIPSFFTFLDGLVRITSMKEIEKQVQKIAATVVVDAMTPDPVTVQPDTDVDDVATLMVEKNIHTLPVVEKEKLVGVVGKDDILRTLITV